MTDENTMTDDTTQPKSQIELAREANNTWTFKGKDFEREMEMYVADGKAFPQTEVMDRNSGLPSGALMLHKLGWESPAAWIARESAFKTQLKRVGRSQDQEIDTAHLITVNSELYRSIVQGGLLKIPTGNGQFTEEEVDRDQMVKFANLYPEGASEAVETFLEQWHFTLFDNSINMSFKFLFEASEFVKVLALLGSRDPQLAKRAGIFTFKTPTSEIRRDYDQAVNRIKSKKQGEVSIAELEENFMAKIRYGTMHLVDVEGIAVGTPGTRFNHDDKKQVQKFIELFCPSLFSDAVDKMHESFDFMKGKSGLN